jgi:hypothetical protein
VRQAKRIFLSGDEEKQVLEPEFMHVDDDSARLKAN